MELNQAFAKHWDKMNPSAHKQSCEHSRQMFEDANKKKEKDKQLEKDKLIHYEKITNKIVNH